MLELPNFRHMCWHCRGGALFFFCCVCCVGVRACGRGRGVLGEPWFSCANFLGF